MVKHDKVHFNTYSLQTNAKHQILKAYLPAYLTALKNIVKCFHYIDGFAGPGLYMKNHPGSPLIAIDEIVKANVSKRTSLSFIESDQNHFDALKPAIENHADIKNFYDVPFVADGLFHKHINDVLGKPIYSNSKSVGTFSFIDPCGVEGVNISDISKLLKLHYGEVLLFFNYDAVTRLLGSIVKGTSNINVLQSLFGDENILKQLIDQWSKETESKRREILIREHYIDALRKYSGVKYILPFRFDAREARKTSHYLVHCCDHALGFTIMKDVMTKAGQQDNDQSYGKMEFLKKDDQIKLDIRVDIDDCKANIVSELNARPCKVSLFTKDWVCKPTDMFSVSSYKKMLKELERDKQIVVFDKNNIEPKPVTKRPKRNNEVTLGDDYWLRINNDS